MKLVHVEAGTFMTGGNRKQEVKLSVFAIGKYPVTFEEYDTYCKAIGKHAPEDEGWGRGKRPVINVTWEDAVAYCEWLSEETGHSYRLPTEAEWEYAGKMSNGYKYSGSNEAEKVAWYNRNSGNKTHPVGHKLPNELGIYDMSGNVWEWCNDCHDNSIGENARVLRGGSWDCCSVDCSVYTYRTGHYNGLSDDDIGFRVVRELK